VKHAPGWRLPRRTTKLSPKARERSIQPLTNFPVGAPCVPYEGFRPLPRHRLKPVGQRLIAPMARLESPPRPGPDSCQPYPSAHRGRPVAHGSA